MREVTFSACKDSELAWETDGRGDFTTIATSLLADDLGDVTNAAFLHRVRKGFGEWPRQTPDLDAAPSALDLPLLQPIGAATLVRAATEPAALPLTAGTERGALATLLRAAADLVDMRP